MKNKLNNVICFSGHRHYGSAPDDEARLEAAVLTAWNEGYRTFISGMAPGFDLAAAEAVVRLRDVGIPLQLTAAVPFAGQPAGYSEVDRARYGTLLAVADDTRVLAEIYSHGCYLRRDDWMVERSGRVICWFDGSRSGTRYTVRRALAHGLEIVNIFRDPCTLF